MDKDRRVSIEAICAQFDASAWTVHTIIREELKMRKICAKFVPSVLIHVTDCLTKLGTKTVPHPSHCPDLAPCDFWLFPKLKETNWGDERGCDEGHWHAHTRGLRSDLAEVVGTVKQVHCRRRRLLRRRLEFHVCTINKSAHTKKVWKLIVCISYQEKLVV